MDLKYVIQSGDTLSQIAENLGVDMRELAKANGIEDMNKIYAGRSLTVPGMQEQQKVQAIQERMEEKPEAVQQKPEAVAKKPTPPPPPPASSEKEQERASITDRVMSFFVPSAKAETRQKPSLLSKEPSKEPSSTLIPSPVKLVTASLFGKGTGTTFTAEDVGEDVVSVISEVGKKARAAGRMNASYEDYPETERGLPVAALVGAARYADGSRIPSKIRNEYARLRNEMYPKNPIGLARFVADVATDPVLKAALTVGGFSIHGTEGNYSIKDRFNFNTTNKSKDDWYAWVRNKLSNSGLMPVGEDEGVRVEFKI